MAANPLSPEQKEELEFRIAAALDLDADSDDDVASVLSSVFDRRESTATSVVGAPAGVGANRADSFVYGAYDGNLTFDFDRESVATHDDGASVSSRVDAVTGVAANAGASQSSRLATSTASPSLTGGDAGHTVTRNDAPIGKTIDAGGLMLDLDGGSFDERDITVSNVPDNESAIAPMPMPASVPEPAASASQAAAPAISDAQQAAIDRKQQRKQWAAASSASSAAQPSSRANSNGDSDPTASTSPAAAALGTSLIGGQSKSASALLRTPAPSSRTRGAQRSPAAGVAGAPHANDLFAGLPKLQLPVLECTPEPLDPHQWHLAIASLLNDQLALRHEQATESAALLLVKSMADNNTLAKQRALHELNTAALLHDMYLQLLQTQQSSAASSAVKPAGAAGAAGRQKDRSSTGSKRTSLSATAAKQVFGSLIPTAAQEADPTSTKADVAFESHMHRVGREDPGAVHKLLRRHLFYCCRLAKGDPWLPAASSPSTAGAMQAAGGAGSSTSTNMTASKATPSASFASAVHLHRTPGKTLRLRGRVDSSDAEGIVRGLPTSHPALSSSLALVSQQRPAVDTVRDISRVVGSHSIGSKTAIFVDLYTRIYKDVIDAGDEEVLAGDDSSADALESSPSKQQSSGNRRLVPRSVVEAAIADLRSYSMLFTKGLLQKYPFLISLPVAKGRTGAQHQHQPQHHETQHHHAAAHHPHPRASIGSSRDRAGSAFSASTQGSSLQRTSSMIQPRAIQQRQQVVPTDLSTAVLRCMQEALHILCYRALFGVIRSHTRSQDGDASHALEAMYTAPPCVHGMSHAFCAKHEPGCTLTQSSADCDVNNGDGGTGGSGSVASPAASGDVIPPVEPTSSKPGQAAQAAESCYRAAIECLSFLTQQRSPLTKLGALRACLNAINHGAILESAVMKQQQKQSAAAAAPVVGSPSAPAGESAAMPATAIARPASPPAAVGADDLVPRLCYVLARARIPRVFAELCYLEDCMPSDRALGEDGYSLVSLRGALMHLLFLGRTLVEQRGHRRLDGSAVLSPGAQGGNS